MSKMWSRIGRVAHPLLTLALVACCAYLLWRDSRRSTAALTYPTTERLSAREDTPLRNLLGVTWLGGDYELPAGEEHCVVVLLMFEDGKFKGRHRGTVFSPKPGGSRVVPFYAMWGPGPNGPRMVSGWPGMWGGSNGDPFYADLGSDLSRAYGDSPLGDLRGYRVIGYASSKQLRAGQERFENIGGLSFDQAIQTHQRVLVLGVKPFATREEAQEWYMNHLERADP